MPPFAMGKQNFLFQEIPKAKYNIELDVIILIVMLDLQQVGLFVKKRLLKDGIEESQWIRL